MNSQNTEALRWALLLVGGAIAAYVGPYTLLSTPGITYREWVLAHPLLTLVAIVCLVLVQALPER